MSQTAQNFVEWDDRFSVGVPLIDSQHKQLLEMTNELYLACRYSSTSAKEQFKKTAHGAVVYVKYHFSTEEQIMEKTAYPEMGPHKKAHAEFVQKVLTDVASFEKGKQFIPYQFVRFLRDWILSHIAITDSKMGNFLLELQKTGKLGKITMKKKTSAGAEKQIVLAVDDSKTQLAQLKQILPQYDVFTCESPVQALEMAKNMVIDIILLDLTMEEMSGYEFLKQLRKDPMLHTIPVIVVSGNKTEKFISAAARLGSNDFIGKPVEPEALLQKIKLLLETKKQP